MLLETISAVSRRVELLLINYIQLDKYLREQVEYNIGGYNLLFYFKAAYNNIHRESLLEAMLELHIPRKLFNFIGMTLKNSTTLKKDFADCKFWNVKYKSFLIRKLFFN